MKLQHAVVTYIVHHSDTNKEIEKLGKTFHKLDKNGDQKLSKEELHNGTKS